MLYKIYHLTKFDYSEPVTESVMEVRMSPRTDERQICRRFALDLKPAAKATDFADFHGNHVHFFDIPKKHTHLEIRAESLVEVYPTEPLPEKVDLDLWAAIDELTYHEKFWEFTHDSRFVRTTDALLGLMKELGVDRSSDVLSDLRRMNSALYEHFEYSQDTTHVDSPIDDAIRARSGVCQDFANIMISMARELNIPCRYVSGYLHHRDDDRSHVAADATHAWVEAYVPTLGWIGFDPTNNLICAERHIRVAVGKDYADVPPTRGIFKGSADSALAVAVRVATADRADLEAPRDAFAKPVVFQTPVQRLAELQEQQQQQQ